MWALFQTEAFKAHLAMAESGTPGAAEIATTIPVSTMHHIVGMVVEVERVSGAHLSRLGQGPIDFRALLISGIPFCFDSPYIGGVS